MTRLVQDIRFGMRFLLKHPGFFAVAILTLAIGIGANTAVFSVVNSVLIRPLPYAEPDRLVLLRHHIGSLDWSDAPLPPADVIDFRERMPALSGVAATDRTFEFNLTGGGPPEVVRVAAVSSNFFDVLGVKAEIGRTFLPSDGFEGRSPKSSRANAEPTQDEPKQEHVKSAPDEYVAPDGAIVEDDMMMPAVVLSHGLWKRRFGWESGRDRTDGRFARGSQPRDRGDARGLSAADAGECRGSDGDRHVDGGPDSVLDDPAKQPDGEPSCCRTTRPGCDARRGPCAGGDRQ